MSNYADGCNVVQRSTSQITMNSNFNQRLTGEVTSIDLAEFKCGICNLKEKFKGESTRDSLITAVTVVGETKFMKLATTDTMHLSVVSQQGDRSEFATESC